MVNERNMKSTIAPLATFEYNENFIPEVAGSSFVGELTYESAKRIAAVARSLAPAGATRAYRNLMAVRQTTQSRRGLKKSSAQVVNLAQNPDGESPKAPEGHYARWVEWRNHGGEQVLRRAAGLPVRRPRR